MLSAAAFYILSATAVLSALMVVIAKNPVRAVLFLILAFFSAAGLFVLLGAEFLAMILVIVYVGAVAVLFLFVVMMLDIDFAQLKEGFISHAPLGGVVALALAGILAMTGLSWVSADSASAALQSPTPEDMTNVAALGALIYDRYVLFFQIAGLVLLVAMIGAIVLTLRHRDGVKRQDMHAQVNRKREDSVEIVDIKSGEGIG
ncbi:MAG: NADH:ubiquinone oxidoreductase subunit J [Oceanicaulis sp.]|uniref:NADH-quinone oxidoreductase subunit J n=1 Tax=unclassified Oceanicaulis TaxID=2632123 RepID=UPI000C68E981|nr:MULTISPECIES: NADH-quinone oxidoreductase subunit J [unclassified Oceanicaulis]MAB69726.1 NADH:ubiquinone oxidoreductase subunit J [Oceanicaulis sp.]MBC39564.1 NADH:ubiquinone oxidoreductase subunit J [Oceanicaulis sp.]MBG34466.1 NADH:ubiquinone oxidoreductase subunit J [Oceanicaulis sp.]HBU63505.1 NADH-quinone oxidoreductase subunit J [Oceanicaulis sp.]HCR95479.1 NADH-quinone oxidoreductase subunit J [Oceanicaulis sp.]